MQTDGRRGDYEGADVDPEPSVAGLIIANEPERAEINWPKSLLMEN